MDYPIALSVKSDALITRAHGLACRLAVMCSRYCWCSSRPGSYCGLWHRGHQGSRASAEPGGQHSERGVIFDRVVQQRRACHVGVLDPVVVQDSDRHPE